jgi:hypothetical protein
MRQITGRIESRFVVPMQRPTLLEHYRLIGVVRLPAQIAYCSFSATGRASGLFVNGLRLAIANGLRLAIANEPGCHSRALGQNPPFGREPW